MICDSCRDLTCFDYSPHRTTCAKVIPLQIKKKEQWGMWNLITKRFVYGINEPTRGAAWNQFKKLKPAETYTTKYCTKIIPKKYPNPANPAYAHYRK